MLNFVSKFLTNSAANFVADASWPLVWLKMIGRTIANTFMNVFGVVWNFITKYIWYVTKWVLGIIDAMQLAFTRLLGLDLKTNTSTSLGEYIDGLKSITTNGSNYYDYLLKIFRAVFGVAIILMIVFTIISMVMQEYKLATNGYQKADNQKGKLIKILLRNIVTIFLMPLIFYTLIVGTNAILTSFYRAIGNYSDTTIAGNVLAASTYDANRYRAYANANKRIPITINVYSMENAFGASRSDEEIKKSIQDPKTQEILKAIGGAFANDSFLPFEKSTTNSGGTWESYKNYSLTINNTVYEDLGDYFENFICTREQYYVLADFVDYCQRYNIKYYVKAMSEPDICWKYVDNISAQIDNDGNALSDISLNIKYRNAEIVNSPSLTTNAADLTDDSYSLSLTTKLDLTSPISDALKTASTLLGVNGETSKFNEMERDDSGDFTNLVSWATRKAFLKLSTVYDNNWNRLSGFRLDDSTTWTYSDQIIVYEYYRFQNAFGSTNNTLEDYTLEDLQKYGAKLDALEMTYRNYNSNTKTYSEEHTLYCVKLNGTYYRLKESTEYFDDYGHAYFVLDVIDPEVNYFTNTVLTIQKNGTKNLKLTGRDSKTFDLNNSDTWGFTSQVLIYEYFKDLSLSNGLRRTNKFTDFVSGVDFEVYKINGVNYIYINGTYYAFAGFGSGNTDNGTFLIPTTSARERYFSYKLSAENQAQYGIGNLGSLFTTAEPAAFTQIKETNAYYQKYSKMNTKLSEDFSFYNSDTWTFRDYALMYLYITKISGTTGNTITTDSLRVFGLSGDIGVSSGGKYYMSIKVGTTTYYLDLEEFSKTSELKITSTISPDLFDNMNLGLSGVDLVSNYTENLDTDRLINSAVSTKVFYLSETFDAYNARTWTIGDYLMIYLTSNGIINIDIGMIELQGYSSVIYEVDGKRYYRFGRFGDGNAFYLDESQISELGYTVEKWFNTNLMSYILVQMYGLDPSDIEFNENDFAGGVVSNPDAYIYSMNGDYTNIKSIQYALAREILKKEAVKNDITMLDYTYSNPEINANDLSTWRYLDLIIFELTGTLPTTENPYKTRLFNSTNIYMEVGDYFVDISSVGLKQCLTDSGKLLTNRLFAKNSRSFSTLNNFNIYYNNNFANSTADSLTDETSLGKFYYYSTNLKGSGNANFSINTIYSDLDMVLVKNNVPMTSDGYYLFDAYSQNGETYIKLKDGLYLGISSRTSALIYFETNSLISKQASIFAKDGEYSSFGGTVNQFDALLYSILNSSQSQTYTIYKFKGDNTKYIKINDTILFYDETLAANSVSTGQFSKEEYVDLLYNLYYKDTFVRDSMPSVKNEYSSIAINAPSDMDFEAYSSWTGIEIILKQLGVADISDCKLLEDRNGKFYLYDEESNKYIILDGLVNVSLIYTSGNVTGATLANAEYEKMMWRLFNLNVLDATVDKFNTPKYFSNSSLDISATGSFSTFKTDVTSYVEQLADLSNTYRNWTLMGLFSAYIDPNRNNQYVYQYYADGSSYYVFEGVDETYIIPSDFNLFEKQLFTYTAAISIVSGSPLSSIIASKGYSCMGVYELTKIKDDSGKGYIIYNMYSSSENKNYGVFGLPDANVASNTLWYLKVAETPHYVDGNPIYDVDQITDLNRASIFEKKTLPISQSGSWNIIDFVVSYTTGTTLGSYIASVVYVYQGRYYVKFNETYVMIPVSGDFKNVFKGVSNNKGEIVDTSVIKLMYALTTIKPCAVQRKLIGNVTISDGIDTFENENLRKATSGALQKVDFSDAFDVSDYTTWKVSDYIIYYAFSNGYFGNSEFKISFPFVYVPKFSKEGDNYYGLTYMDVILSKFYGTETVDGVTQYKYLTSAKSSYKFNVIYPTAGSEATKNYYLEMIDTTGLVETNKVICISDEVALNFMKMQIESLEIDEILTNETMSEKIEEIKTRSWIDKASLISGTDVLKTTFTATNFQTFANAGGVPARTYYLYKEDETSGSTTIQKVIDFSAIDTGKTGSYFNYNKFFEFYDKFLKGYLTTTKVNELDIAISTTNPGAPANTLVMKLEYSQVFPDLEFDNYFYFNLNSEILKDSGLMNVPQTVSEAIKTGESSLERGTLNLRFSSEDFKLKDISNWTVLDYIMVYEYSREGIRHNKFKGMSFEELMTDDYYINDIYIDGDKIYLYINYNFYNISGIVEKNGDVYVGKTTKMNATKYEDLKTTLADTVDPTKTLNGLVTASDANINKYDFRALYETLDLSLNPTYVGSMQVTRDKNNISYQIGDVIYFKYIDTNVADANFRINVSRFGKYSVKTLIKTVSWVEKLMNDMQIYYPDLNWGVLLATDGWLDTLGEFTSAYTNGLYISGQNSSNTTAAGLVLSEFFMSVATEVSDSYANYEYSSVFDKNTIRALMLSLMGEECYNALVFEAEVFMDYFNSCFAPIIDDFATEFGEDIGSNSLRLCAYKSYLATLLLGSDIGEYLYTVATRVYSEYTIGEYLASAVGDYASYYSYVNNLKDEEGNTIDSFEYATFEQLVRYENEYCGNNQPTFTFNFKKAYSKYKDKTTAGDKLGYNYDTVVSSSLYYTLTLKEVIEAMDNDYKDIYNNGYTISESGKVIDSESQEVESYAGKEYIFCYMIHVYWEIKYELGRRGEPIYLSQYKSYIDGNISRWNILKGENIDTADQYYETAGMDKAKLVLYKGLSFATTVRLYLPGIALSDNNNEGIVGKLKSLLEILDKINTFKDSIGDSIRDNGILPIVNAYDLFDNNASLTADLDFIKDNSVSIYFRMSFSEDSSFQIVDILKDVIDKLLPADLSTETSWAKILEFSERLDSIIGELQAIRFTLPGETTDNGCDRQIGDTSHYYSDTQLDAILSAFQDLKYNINQYITAQRRIDQMYKRSITFTLAQFGANYVSSGYSFSVRNKNYTFKSNTDPSRLAEYVYGGAFLEKVGVGAQYTTAEFEGIVKASKVYDNVDKVLKTNLDTWPELRRFLSKIADETAEIYFMTNLGDLDTGKVNAVKISDAISCSFIDSTGATITASSIEEMLYSIMASQIDSNIVNRLIDGKDNVHDKFVAVALYLFSNEVDAEELEDITYEDFKRIVLQKLIDNEQNTSETPEERSARYMALFNLIGLQIDFSSDGKEVGRIIPKANITRNADNSLTYQEIVKIYNSNNGDKSQVENYAGPGDLKAVFTLSDNTLEVVKKLSGLENRPTREVLTRQYSGTRTGDYYDEAYGDSFIVCTYKNGLYYPLIGSGSYRYSSDKYDEYLEKIYDSKPFVTDYYDIGGYVVVMKGVITADGYPTAIRKYNNPLVIEQKRLIGSSSETYNAVTYYRTNVGGNFGSGEDLIDASKAVSRITTKNYTKYVSGTSYTKGIGSATTYTGKTNLKTIVKSDVNTNFVQSKVEYLMLQSDEFGAIDVLDDFSYFYLFGGQTWVLLMLAFVTIIPVMINALGGVVTRIFDLIVLFIASPLVISTNSLYPDGKNKTYTNWKKNIESVLLGVFGYIIGFSSFTIIVPMIYSVKTFVSVETFNKIVSIGGIGGFFSYPTINNLVRCLWVITAVSILERMPKLILPIITANHGNLSSPDPGLGEGSRKFLDKAKEVKSSVEKTAAQIGSVVSGKAMLGLMQEAKETALSMIPGYEVGKAAKEKFVDPMVDKVKNIKIQAEQKAIEVALQGAGIDPVTAKAAGAAVAEADKKKQEAKKKDKEQMQKFKQDFQKNFE